MSWLPDIKQRILAALLVDHLDHFQIAADLGEAAFRVRAELRDLRRMRLVTSRFEPDRVAWELTPLGERAASSSRQMTLGGV